MNFTLTERLDDYIEYEGARYALDLSFDNVLRVLELFGDTDFTKGQKAIIAFDMLVRDEIKVDIDTKAQIILFILKDFLDIDFDQLETSDAPKKPPVYDLKADASYIYASFLQDYNIDLIEQQGKLHWKKFQALLTGLREKTKFREVVGIRTMDIPAPTEHNKEQRDHIMKLKEVYKLNIEEDQKTIEERVDATFNQVANFLRAGR